MIITDSYITNKRNRPGRRLGAVRGLVVHWIGAAQSSARVIRNNFDDPNGRQGSAQYIIDWDTGEIIRTMPETEVAYHVGANRYTALKERICGAENPNNYLIGAECCIGDKSIPCGWESSAEIGRPSERQYAALTELAADVCSRHGLDPLTQLYRHYDITGKLCPVWFVNNPGRWERLKRDVKERMEGADMAGATYKTLEEVPEWGREVVRRLADRGTIKGDGTGSLDITHDLLRMLVILDREGVLK